MTQAGSDLPLAPARPGDRLIVLDATRGLAVMGILLMNIIGFSMPYAGYVNPVAWGGTSVADLTVWTVNQLLFEGRMRGLFALLFGVSALLVMERADAAGGNGALVHLKRMAVLAVIGFAHAVLLWEGDILLHYALVGLVAPWLRHKSPAQLLGLGAAVLIVATLAWSVIIGEALALEHAARAPGATPQLVRDAREMMTAFPAVDSQATAEEVARMRGGYGPIVAYRWARGADGPVEMLMVLGGETLAFMLAGMALWIGGLFSGGWSGAALKRLIGWTYALSLPPLALLTWWAFASGFDPIVLTGNFIGWAVPFRVVCAIGHLALAVLLVRRFAASPMVARLAAVGRMALTNYLATSLVMTTIFYGYGLGLFGYVDRAAVYGFVLPMWLAMLLWSAPWLADFRFGPVEWLWRSLARGRPQPMWGPAR